MILYAHGLVMRKNDPITASELFSDDTDGWS